MLYFIKLSKLIYLGKKISLIFYTKFYKEISFLYVQML